MIKLATGLTRHDINSFELSIRYLWHNAYEIFNIATFMPTCVTGNFGTKNGRGRRRDRAFVRMRDVRNITCVRREWRFMRKFVIRVLSPARPIITGHRRLLPANTWRLPCLFTMPGAGYASSTNNINGRAINMNLHERAETRCFWSPSYLYLSRSRSQRDDVRDSWPIANL